MTLVSECADAQLFAAFKSRVRLMIPCLFVFCFLSLSSCARIADNEETKPISYLQVAEGFVIEEAVSPELISFPHVCKL
ncbi:hypothetical protein [Sphingobacterium sp.]|uniref:hypothetical protein n=1 Tax=Sphingobacterium sp. TaxID=341027 RepID=UPI00289E09C8|nr:hypothetical protein [Sphingobacterium sp.]